MNAQANALAIFKTMKRSYKKAKSNLDSFSGNMDSEEWVQLHDIEVAAMVQVINAGFEWLKASNMWAKYEAPMTDLRAKAERNAYRRRQLLEIMLKITKN